MRTLPALLLLLLCILIPGCTRIHLDPNGGAETLMVRTIDHPDQFQVEYLRDPAEGPIVHDQNAWTLLWFIPMNHPDLGLWLQQSLPEDASAANVRASVKTPWYGWLIFFPTLTLVRVDRVHYEAEPVRLSARPAGESPASSITSP